ncbi:hypothetical protein LTR17_005818 [Elasticomyces elasticus]|nr:hypothetical protein LTR17_005818 [Elasticomyces elasticus]
MATRRSKCLAGKYLGNDFNEIIARSTNEAYRKTSAFRLLDLPPELRELIYAYATSIACVRYLGKLRLPPLALVSKQLRAEVLPQYFAQQFYEANATSNYTEIQSIEEEYRTLDGLDAADQERLQKDDRARRLSHGYIRDTSSLKNTLMGMREREQYTPLFRNVHLGVFAGHNRPNPIHACVERITFALSVPSKRVLQPQVTLIEPAGGSFFPDEVVRMLVRVRGKADEIAKGRERFLGFTFDDLEALAKEFCFDFESV